MAHVFSLIKILNIFNMYGIFLYPSIGWKYINTIECPKYVLIRFTSNCDVMSNYDLFTMRINFGII